MATESPTEATLSSAREGADPAPLDPESRAVRTWSVVLLASAFALFFLGGGVENFRAKEVAGLPEGVELPVLDEPRGLIESPPTLFRWSGGGEPDLVQLVVYDNGYMMLWESRPLPPGTTEHEVPSSVFDGAPPGIEHYWRIRQVADGKPHANSDMVGFTFKVDNRGSARGQAPPPERR